MLGSELVTQILQHLEDNSNNIYPSAEVYRALNSNKDEVLALVQNYTDQYPQTTASFTIAAGSAEVALTSTIIEPLYFESTRTGEDYPRRVDLVGFRNKDLIETNDNFYVRRGADGVWNVGRRNTDDAITGTVYAIAEVDDIDATSATNTSFTFGPMPADQLIVIGTVADLMAARKRQEKGYWEDKANRLRASLIGNLNNYNKTGADYVNYVED